ncbi:hypothetical protein AB0I55_05045 [Actinocatenispora sera]|uniref:hypothetical protein n=1 Tax=Actinocatenispora sera TaxID=390989 RepID=UPI0033C8817C
MLAPADGTGDERFAVLDFEWSGRDVWVADLTRLAVGPWRDDPELAAAFLAGYGRAIGALDRAMLLRCAAARAVFLAVWGHRHGEVALERSARDQFARLSGELPAD